MLTVQTTRFALAAILDRLSNPTNGFNPRITPAVAQLATDLNLRLPTSFKLPIHFATTGSKNFFTADLEPDMLPSTMPYTLPLVTLFTRELRNTQMEKYRQIAGPATFGINVFLTWPASSAASVLEPLASVFQDSLISTFNDDSDPALSLWAQRYANANPSVGTSLVYGQDIIVQRSAIVADGESWSVALHTRLTLEIFTN